MTFIWCLWSQRNYFTLSSKKIKLNVRISTIVQAAIAWQIHVWQTHKHTRTIFTRSLSVLVCVCMYKNFNHEQIHCDVITAQYCPLKMYAYTHKHTRACKETNNKFKCSNCAICHSAIAHIHTHICGLIVRCFHLEIIKNNTISIVVVMPMELINIHNGRKMRNCTCK